MEHEPIHLNTTYEDLTGLFASDRSKLSEKDVDLLDLSLSLDHGTPYFKIKHFVGDSQITAYAKYKQLLLELRSREEIVESLLVQIAKQEMVIEITKEEIDLADTPLKIKKAQFELITNQNDLIKIHRRLKMAYEERELFLKALKDMYETGEAILPDGTDLKDAVLDPIKSEKLEAQHWVYRLGKQAALDFISYGKIGTGNMEAISQLEEDDQVKALSIALDWNTRVNGALETIQKEVVAQLENKKQYSIGLSEDHHVTRLALDK